MLPTDVKKQKTKFGLTAVLIGIFVLFSLAYWCCQCMWRKLCGIKMASHEKKGAPLWGFNHCLWSTAFSDWEVSLILISNTQLKDLSGCCSLCIDLPACSVLVVKVSTQVLYFHLQFTLQQNSRYSLPV